jgi:hypothetical protein
MLLSQSNVRVREWILLSIRPGITHKLSVAQERSLMKNRDFTQNAPLIAEMGRTDSANLRYGLP